MRQMLGRGLSGTWVAVALMLAIGTCAHAASSLDDIRARGLLRVGVKTDAPPFGARTRQIVTKKNAPHCRASKDEEYVFVLEKPRSADCVYIDFSPWTFGWSLWQPRSP